MHRYFVYITTNYDRTVLYIGVTRDLPHRIDVHKSESVPGFASKYHANILIYSEPFDSIIDAIVREKQLKRWSRAKKEWLIGQINPSWDELSS